MNLPVQFIERINSTFPSSVAKALLESYESKRLPTIRVNTLKTSPEQLTKYLESKNIETEPVVWMPTALTVRNADTRQLTELEAYINGEFYIQSLSSMIPALILDPKENEVALDMASAPGSKTTQIASMMKNTGRIVANDSSRERIFKLQRNLEQQHVTNTEVTSKDGQSLWKDHVEEFDKVLIDVPCSMEGTFDSTNPNSYKYWSAKKVKQLSKMQRWLLRSAVSCTKPGGTIVYSTCTLSIDENEAVIDWILDKEKNSIHLEEIIITGLQSYSPFLEFKHKLLSPDLKKTLRILPSPTMEGFFVAKMKKIKSNTRLHLSEVDEPYQIRLH